MRLVSGSTLICLQPPHTFKNCTHGPRLPPYFPGLLNAALGHHSLLCIAIIVIMMTSIIHGAPSSARAGLDSLLTLPHLVPPAALLR